MQDKLYQVQTNVKVWKECHDFLMHKLHNLSIEGEWQELPTLESAAIMRELREEIRTKEEANCSLKTALEQEHAHCELIRKELKEKEEQWEREKSELSAKLESSEQKIFQLKNELEQSERRHKDEVN